MNYLVVVAHPDDEVLGAGGTIFELVKSGNNVDVAVLCSSVNARANRSKSLMTDFSNAIKLLGVNKIYVGNFPNIQMNIVPHLELVKFVENCIFESKAQGLITHHPSDTNNDHVQTSYAVQAASRLFQRRNDVPYLKLLLYMEVASSTEWSFDSSSIRFLPNYFVELGEDGVNIKLQALSYYKGVMRDYPHPRSKKAIIALATYRGVQAGCNYGEAFECVFVRK